ncbi:MAG: DNA polymerase III subunit delta' [Bacteroidetes bacterium]|nr:DNA polymerase III subunit delta' [Bacteroidota bacterium]
MLFGDIIGYAKEKKALLNEVKEGRISHAQLFLGPEGSAKLPLAIAFSGYLLCENPGPNDACGKCPGCQKISSLVHPDLHFAFPVVLSATEKIACSDDRRSEWNNLILKNPYFDLNTWQEYLDERGKNAVIGVEESRSILQKLSLKSYSGKYKIMIIWLPERMNNSAANKLLKMLEEPPEQTLFFLLSDSIENMLPTIISRTQLLKIAPFETDDIARYLETKFAVDKTVSYSVAGLAQGNMVEAIQMVSGDENQHIYFDLFVKMMRTAYAANAFELMSLSDELAALEKEQQKNFIKYGLHLFRESVILNYMKGELVNLRNEERAFLEKFARFINNHNISELNEEFNEAFYHLERNASAKILFTDLVIKLTKLIKKGV